METIKLYRYEAGCHAKGGLFPPYDERQTDWSPNKEEQVNLYNTVSKEHFDFYQLDEMKFYNKFPSSKDKNDFMFIWCFLFEIEVPLKEWKKCVKNDDYEPLGYIVDFDYKSIAEKGMYPNGVFMSKKKFESIVYEPYLKTNKNGSGVFKPKDVIYGNVK
jgi:hypothetical protein